MAEKLVAEGSLYDISTVITLMSSTDNAVIVSHCLKEDTDPQSPGALGKLGISLLYHPQTKVLIPLIMHCEQVGRNVIDVPTVNIGNAPARTMCCGGTKKCTQGSWKPFN